MLHESSNIKRWFFAKKRAPIVETAVKHCDLQKDGWMFSRSTSHNWWRYQLTDSFVVLGFCLFVCFTDFRRTFPFLKHQKTQLIEHLT